MTYAQFLALFLGVPIIVLTALLWRRWKAYYSIACVAVCGLAFVYTSPWDNHAAKIKLWTFDPHFAPPSHFVYYLPWEEYAFYFAQGVLICLVVTALSQKLRPAGGEAEL